MIHLSVNLYSCKSVLACIDCKIAEGISMFKSTLVLNLKYYKTLPIPLLLLLNIPYLSKLFTLRRADFNKKISKPFALEVTALQLFAELPDFARDLSIDHGKDLKQFTNFLLLPTEIRLQIWCICFPNLERISIRRLYLLHPPRHDRYRPFPKIPFRLPFGFALKVVWKHRDIILGFGCLGSANQSACLRYGTLRLHMRI